MDKQNSQILNTENKKKYKVNTDKKPDWTLMLRKGKHSSYSFSGTCSVFSQ